MKLDKKTIKNIVISTFLIVGIIAITIFIMTYEKNELKQEEVIIELSSDLVSTDPKVSASNFIIRNGTMGDVENDINGDSLINSEAGLLSVKGRYEALKVLKEAVVPGNLIITGEEDKYIDKLATPDCIPTFHQIRDLKVSEPGKTGKLVVYSDNGNIEYTYTDVYVDFNSAKIWYQWGRDADWDGNVMEIENVEKFENIKVTLVQSGELWFIYNIEDAEKKLNSRFATWNGKTEESYGPEDTFVRTIQTNFLDNNETKTN